MSTIKTTNIQHPSAASAAIEMTAAGGLWLGGGKILQVVRATDSTNRSTTSTSFVDANLSVTITPQKSDSAVLLIGTGAVESVNGTNNDLRSVYQITDTSDNPISGASDLAIGSRDLTRSGTALIDNAMVIIAYDTPATTSAKTYKIRFRSNNASCTTQMRNATSTAQFFAIEVSA